MEGGRVGKKGLRRGRAVYIEKLIKEQSARFLLALSFLLFVFLDANMILEITKLFLIQGGTDNMRFFTICRLPSLCLVIDWMVTNGGLLPAIFFFLKL